MTFLLVVVGWLITLAATVVGKPWLLAVAAPFLVLSGAITLRSRRAWLRMVSVALPSGMYKAGYRERVASSSALRRFMSAGLLLVGVAWFAMGLFL